MKDYRLVINAKRDFFVFLISAVSAVSTIINDMFVLFNGLVIAATCFVYCDFVHV